MNRRDLVLLVAGAMIAPRAQQKKMPVVGFLSGASPAPSAPYLAAFLQGLSESGYVEGQNVTIEYRWAEGRYDRLPALAAELVIRKVEVIAALGGTPPALAAKNATATIPIVFGAGDPVGLGLVASLARPGGNLTGTSGLELELVPKLVELMSELVPSARIIALLVTSNNPVAEHIIIQNAQQAASAKGLELQILKASTEGEIDAAFVELQAGGLIVQADPLFNSRREQLVGLPSRRAMPAISAWREFAEAGGLISYGASRTGGWHKIGTYVGKILNGAKPADLPVEQPTRFDLVVNLKTAKALGLTVPPSILARATEVIE